MNEIPEVLSPDDVAEMMKIKRATVHKMVRRGQLYGFKCGGSLRITKESVEKMVKNRLME